MSRDALTLLALVVAAVPAFASSPRAFGIAIVLGLVSLPLLADRIVNATTMGYADTLGGAVAVMLVVAVFLSACTLRSILMSLAAARRRSARKGRSDPAAATRGETP